MRRDLLYLLLIVPAFVGGFFTGRQQEPPESLEHRIGKIEAAIENSLVSNPDVRHSGSKKTVPDKTSLDSRPVHDESTEFLIPPEKLAREKSNTARPVLDPELINLKEQFKASLATSGIPEDQLRDMAEEFAESHLRTRQSMNASPKPKALFPGDLREKFQASLREAGIPEKDIQMMSMGAFRQKKNTSPLPEHDGSPFFPDD